MLAFVTWHLYVCMLAPVSVLRRTLAHLATKLFLYGGKKAKNYPKKKGCEKKNNSANIPTITTTLRAYKMRIDINKKICKITWGSKSGGSNSCWPQNTNAYKGTACLVASGKTELHKALAIISPLKQYHKKRVFLHIFLCLLVWACVWFSTHKGWQKSNNSGYAIK